MKNVIVLPVTVQVLRHFVMSGFHCTFFSTFIFCLSRILQTYLYTKETESASKMSFQSSKHIQRIQFIINLDVNTLSVSQSISLVWRGVIDYTVSNTSCYWNLCKIAF